MARELGLDEFHAELLPGDKVDQVERLLAQKQPKENLVFVGDGINDAPVLSRADIGVAMGALGSDAAIEAADIVLMDDDLSKLAQAVRIARKTLSIVRQNIVFALAVKGLVLVLSALGYVGMWWAVFADVGVSVICHPQRLAGAENQGDHGEMTHFAGRRLSKKQAVDLGPQPAFFSGAGTCCGLGKETLPKAQRTPSQRQSGQGRALFAARGLLFFGCAKFFSAHP